MGIVSRNLRASPTANEKFAPRRTEPPVNYREKRGKSLANISSQ